MVDFVSAEIGSSRMNSSEENMDGEGNSFTNSNTNTSDSSNSNTGSNSDSSNTNSSNTDSNTSSTTNDSNDEAGSGDVTNTNESEQEAEEKQDLTMDAQGSAVQIAENPEEQETDDDVYMILGDRWEITSPLYDGPIKGVIYYLDESSLIRILPDGISNRLYDFKIVDGDFDPDLKITEPPLRLNKAPKLDSGLPMGFVDLIQAEVNKTFLTFQSDETRGPTVTVEAINFEQDSFQIKDENGETRTISCDRIGLPLNESFVIMVKEYTEGEELPLTPEQIAEEEAARQRALIQGADSAAALGEDDEEFEEVGEIELPELAVFQKLAASDVVYDELTQKSDFYDDLINLLDGPSQQNPLLQKRIRALVEMSSSLKNSIIQRAEDGRPMGPISTISLQSMADVLTNRSVPIARPILKTKRVLVYEKEGNDEEQPQISIQSFFTLVEESGEFFQRLADIPKPDEDGVGIPRWYQALYKYFQKYPMGDVYLPWTNDHQFVEDGEYFRTAAPEEDSVEGFAADTFDGENPNLFIQTISQSYRRGHGPTVRPIAKGGVEIAIPADRAPINGYVLFPYQSVETGAIGAIRSGKLWEDIVRSSPLAITWMKKIIEDLGGISTTKDAQSIIHIPTADAEAVGIPFSDYLTYVLETIVPFGQGDLFALKRDLGVNDVEPNLDQQSVIQARVQSVYQSLVTYINQLREEIAKEKTPAIVQSVFDTNFIQSTLDTFKRGNHTILEQLTSEFASRTPGYRQVDIALTAFMLVYAQDYFLSVLGGQQALVERERIRASRDRLLQTLQNSVALEKLKRELGRPPERNPCAHVQALQQIRKIPDDVERMALFTKFVAKFRGLRQENWEMCVLCKKELICHHEVLQIQQFLHPVEIPIIQKEIILQYAGGTFGSKHICRNCGLPVAELDFEKGLEFDDEGRPMMGRAVLVDTEQAEKDAIETMLGVRIQPTEEDEEVNFQDSVKNEFYKLARVIVNMMGVQFDGMAYRKLVERAVVAKLKLFVNQKAYLAQKAAGKVKHDYATYNAMEKIALTAALVLLEIQIHRPNYVIRFTVDGCRAGFEGFPLQRDADPDSPDQSVGLHYISCAIAGVTREEAPWSFGFQKMKKDDRAKTVLKFVKLFVKALAEDVEIQEELERKRIYTSQMTGVTAKSARASDVIPAGFLPQMMTHAESAEAAANSPVIAEGTARGQLGDILRSSAWIRAAHRIAKQTTIVVKGSPFAETACCFDPITVPGSFWRTADLPRMPERTGLAHGFQRYSILGVPIAPPLPLAFTATAPLSKAYLVYFKLCYKGPRVGLMHEIGYDHKCDWCGITIPTQFLYPEPEIIPANAKEEAALLVRLAQRENEIRSLFDAQGIPVTDQSFQALLDASHRRTEFKSYITPPAAKAEEIIEQLEAITPSPIQDWPAQIKAVQANLLTLGAANGQPSEVEIAMAFEPFGTGLQAAEAELKRYKFYEPLVKILQMPQPQSIFEIVRSYFLLPAKRILQQYDFKTELDVPVTLKLAPEHTKQLNGMIEQHCMYLTSFNDQFEEENNMKAKYKLQMFVSQLTQVLDQANELSIRRIIYNAGLPSSLASRFLKEILRVCIMGPIGDLINEASPVIVDGEEYEIDEGTSSSLLRQFVATLLKQFSKEALSYDPAEVRSRIEEAREAEKQRFISILDKMDESQRKIEMEKKRRGIGGLLALADPRLAYKYDKDQWLKNQEDLTDAKNYALLHQAGPNGEVPLGDEQGAVGDHAEEGGYDVHYFDED